MVKEIFDTNTQNQIFSVFKNNFRLLLSQQYSKNNINEIKKKIREKINNPTFVIKLTQIAELLIVYLIKIKRITDKDSFSKIINSCGFLNTKLIIKEFQYYINKYEIDDGVLELLNIADLSKDTNILKQEDEYKELLDKERTRIKRDIEQDLSESFDEIKREKEYINTFKSFIDDEILLDEKILIGRINEEIDFDKKYLSQNLLWYKNLGLERDPFPSVYGLDKIEENDYDKIVYQTSLYEKYIKYLNNETKVLYGRSFIIYGEYGCGKSTFFEYLSYILMKKKILPIYIIMNGCESLIRLWFEFRNNVSNILSNEIKEIKGYDPRLYEHNINDNLILTQLKGLKSRYNGFFLFIDGLHKSQDKDNNPAKFLMEFQNFLEYLEKEQINICVFVAGSNEWEKNIKYNEIFSGSIYQSENIPAISVDVGYEMLLKRFFTYQSSILTTEYFTKNDIERLINTYKQTSSKQLTFRRLIHEFLNRGYITSNKIKFNQKIEADILKIIQMSFSENIEIFQNLLNFITKYNDKIWHIQEVINIIYENKYINDNSEILKSHKNIIALLVKSGIIIKVKDRDENIKFIIDRELFRIFVEIDKKTTLSPGYYLDRLHKKADNIENDQIIDINIQPIERWMEEAPRYKEDLKKIRQKIIHSHNKLVSSIENSSRFTIESINIQQMKGNIEELLKFIYTLSNEEELKNKDEIFVKFRYSWLDNEPLINFLTYLDDFDNQQPTKEYNRKFLSGYCDAYEALIRKIGKHLRYNNILSVGSKELTDNDKRMLNKCRAFYSQRMLPECIKSFHSYLENKIRNFICILMRLKYGDHDWSDYLPQNVINEIKSRKSSEIKKYGKNLHRSHDLYLINRGDYLLIIQHQWKNVFSFLGTYNRSIIEKIGPIFNISNYEKHDNENKTYKGLEDQIKVALEDIKMILKIINNCYLKILNNKCFKVFNTNEVQFLDGKGISLKIVNNNDSLSDIKNILIKYSEDSQKYHENYIPLDNPDKLIEVFEKYDLDIYCILAILIHENKIEIQDYEGSSICFNVI